MLSKKIMNVSKQAWNSPAKATKKLNKITDPDGEVRHIF